jgi:hypothetical protein
MWMTGSRPNQVVLQQVLIDIGRDGLFMAQWRDATNGKAGRLTHKVGIGLFQLFPDQVGGAFFMDTVATAGNIASRLLQASFVRLLNGLSIRSIECPRFWRSRFMKCPGCVERT